MSGKVFRFICACQEAQEGVVLATVVRCRGSAPAQPGSRMAVSATAAVGTVGGGVLELRVVAAAREVLLEGRPRLLRLVLDREEAAGVGMLCGGEQDIFLDLIRPTPTLVIFGGGHVGSALARVAAASGFAATVVDDRAEFVRPDDLPRGCRGVRLDYGGDWLGLGVGADTAIVIATRGHEYDRLVLERALATPARYIGMIGSRKKVAAIQAELRAAGLAGIDDPRVYTPIGLDLGGRSPGAIAVSILAEIIAVREGGAGGHLRSAPPPA